MSIRLKILFIVLPLLIVSMVLAGTSSYFVATNSINRVTTELLSFKAFELEKYVQGQWNLLVENNFTGRPEMVAATQAGVLTFAQSIVRSDTELILAVNQKDEVAMISGDAKGQPDEIQALKARFGTPDKDHSLEIKFGGVERVGKGFSFPPFGWYVIVTEAKQTFYSDVERITRETALILVVAVIVATILLLFFVRFISRPLEGVVKVMQGIITSNDLTKRVTVEYQDEIGQVSHTFNVMIGELDKAYSQIKKYAFEAVLAQKKERKVRNIFQKYVPQEIIDRLFQNPESMLVGENRHLAVLFSDIRGFTTISEQMRPDDLVNNLNRYFNIMVDIIMEKGGIIDKYIGDAIMCFFGAPVKHDKDALNSILAAFGMMRAVKEFNLQQVQQGKPEFLIGIGVNYGLVTVGNIGSEKKMDYTVIGDSVNLASRLEGLTKEYHSELVFAEFLYEEVKNEVSCRLLDAVAVKGKKKGVRIYTAKPDVTDLEKDAWTLHNQGMELYFDRKFEQALGVFTQVQLKLGQDDFPSAMMLERCEEYRHAPPGEDWDGVKVMKTK